MPTVVPLTLDGHTMTEFALTIARKAGKRTILGQSGTSVIGTRLSPRAVLGRCAVRSTGRGRAAKIGLVEASGWLTRPKPRRRHVGTGAERV